ncbi:phosphatidylinositol-glycan biosynthesis class W protein-like isoform X2 [Varroa jacobsoni]|uniref:Phosphatidylinositol-glycan biosynthesis class W protein n=1 Tax=Varroa destructor TaxID=109461 RepID=A0A7M7K0B4_VARDE|nr:phosphatidylinositol-glycan biosynthesis class W protein-like isoform X2 [Varroa destructor]XP_022692670.1 phosphatidylinositol-glycan biosynthesis class W protein-like isoform X2 [Varroa jacobsoni]
MTMSQQGGGSRREVHEQFVSGGAGCEFYEVLAVCGLVVLSATHQFIIRSLMRFLLYDCKILRWSLDLTLLCLPSFMAMALTDQFLNVCMVLISLIIMFATILTFSAHRRAKEARVIHDPLPECRGKLHHHAYFIPLSYTRAATLAVTLVCILAVDFPILPRRQAKTETYGFSLMDIGIGLFVCIAAGLSAIKKDHRFRSEFKSAAGMFVLGIIRLVFVVSMDYQAPIMEYGKHLNFFLCFAVTKIICALYYAIFPAHWDVVVGSAVYLCYQLALQCQPVDFYLHSVNRDGFLAANKEGLASIIGSSCLFLITTAVCRRFVYKVKNCKSEWFYFVFQMLLLSSSCMASSLLMHSDRVPVSRRLFNLSYSLWVLSLFLIFLVACTLLRFIDLVSSCGGYNLVTLQHLSPEVDTVDDILQSFNKGAVWVFLLGNVLTGAINKMFEGTISTLDATLSLPILSAYLATLTIFVLVFFPKPKITRKDAGDGLIAQTSSEDKKHQ